MQIGDAAPRDPADDAADIRHGQREARGDEREAQRFRQVDDDESS